MANPNSPWENYVPSYNWTDFPTQTNPESPESGILEPGIPVRSYPLPPLPNISVQRRIPYDPTLLARTDPTIGTGFQFPALPASFSDNAISMGGAEPDEIPAPSAAAVAAQPQRWPYGFAYAPPSHLEGEPGVRTPEGPPGMDVPEDTQVRLANGVLAIRQSKAAYDRMIELQKQAKEAQEAAQQAQLDAQTFAQISRTARSMSDIVNAKRMIDMERMQRDYQKLVTGGMTPEKALYQSVAGHPFAFGSGFGAALHYATPAGQETVVQPSGTTPGYIRDAHGNIRFFPTSGQLPEASVKVLPDGTRIIQVSPEKWQVLDKGPVKEKPGSLTDAEKEQLRALDNEAHQKRTSIDQIRQDSPQWIAGMRRLAQIANEREAILSRAGGAEAPTSKKAVIAVLGQGTKEDPARPTTKEQLDSLPTGAIYLNPSDGKLYQKK